MPDITLWDQYCAEVAHCKVYFRLPNGFEILLNDEIKATMLGQAIEESGRGTQPPAVEANNFHALKYRPDIPVTFPIDKFPFDGGDGLYDYCKFRTLREEIIGWFCFILGRQQYAGVLDHLENGRDFLNAIGRTYCPPGYTEDWASWHNGLDYTAVIYDVHRLEALREIAKYGQDAAPIILPPDPEGEFTIQEGRLYGPDVHFRKVKNFDNWKRSLTDGVVLHATGSNAGTSKIIVDGLVSPGIFDGWDNLSEQRSAHALILEVGRTWQAVDLRLIAWHTYKYNPRKIGIELENMGWFYPYQEEAGWFYRFKGQPWQQKVNKSELELVKGIYYKPFPTVQIATLNRILPVIYKAFPTILSIDPHSKFSATWDPGPLLDFSKIVQP